MTGLSVIVGGDGLNIKITPDDKGDFIIKDITSMVLFCDMSNYLKNKKVKLAASTLIGKPPNMFGTIELNKTEDSGQIEKGQIEKYLEDFVKTYKPNV